MSSGRLTSTMTVMDWRAGLRYALALAAMPAPMACGLWISPLKAEFWSYHLQFVVVAATLAWCLRLLFRSSYPRPLLLGLTAAIGLWTLAIAIVLVDLDILNQYADVTNYTYLLFVSFGIPLLYIAATYGDPHASRSQQVLDALLLALLGLLYWASVMDVLDVHGAVSPTGRWYARHAQDAECTFLALAHVVRWLTAGSAGTRRFFRITSVFLVSYTLCIGVHNNFEVGDVGVTFMSVLGDMLPPVPFVALGLMLYHWRGAPAEAAEGAGLSQRVALGASPILFLMAIFAVGLSIEARHTVLVLSIVGLAVAAYVLRTVQTQYRYVRAQDRLLGMAEALERLSYTDAVTELPNRRAFDRAFAREWAAAARTSEHMSVLMIDVDKFKEYNDLYGHHAGDRCLRAVARMAAGALHRPADFCGRYGGEEFVILLPATPVEGAELVARRILGHIHAANLPHARGVDGRVTVSIGISARGTADMQAESLMERADRNLYRAKGSGRNCCDASETGLQPRLRLVEGRAAL